ncbi:class I SAM-dependent methyltransferase [Corynebacterium wankanglinii]|uniref:class I SAM-dependent methyltransferase n=1 Tax=Corynebacterium wankanglinii TaxID=2735136 RepID=UPI002E298D3D|nr:class I SAM-dependent methyltransferase [Corynebacterium wankanglinii]
MTELGPLSPDLPAVAQKLAQELTAAGFTADGVAAHLGPEATEAMYRREPGVVLAACADDSRLSALIRFFVLRRPATAEAIGDMLTPQLALELIDDQLVLPVPGASTYQVGVEVRAHVVSGKPRFVFSDLDASMTDHVPGRDHVLGVGSASLSLLAATPCTPVESVLDLGTGSGIQALAQSDAATTVVATDVHARALQFAQATMLANGVDNVELREGAWFEPVARERFDRIVANPPFVVGLPEVGHVYRDSGLDLDGATELVLRETPSHLAEGGRAFILGSWLHVLDQPWQSRIASWLPSRGVNAWVLQRDVVDPGMYVSTWLRDESVDPRSDEGITRTLQWLDHFQEHDVHAVGFGWVMLEDIGDAPSEITCEELAQPFTDPLGTEAEEYFLRTGWLRGKNRDAILDASYLIRPSVALEDIQLANAEAGMGFSSETLRMTRTDGPRFSHTVDSGMVSLLSGLHPNGLSLRDVVGLFAVSHDVGEPEDVDKLEADAASAIVDLIRHGLVLPAEIAQLTHL